MHLLLNWYIPSARSLKAFGSVPRTLHESRVWYTVMAAINESTHNSVTLLAAFSAEIMWPPWKESSGCLEYVRTHQNVQEHDKMLRLLILKMWKSVLVRVMMLWNEEMWIQVYSSAVEHSVLFNWCVRDLRMERQAAAPSQCIENIIPDCIAA